MTRLYYSANYTQPKIYHASQLPVSFTSVYQLNPRIQNSVRQKIHIAPTDLSALRKDKQTEGLLTNISTKTRMLRLDAETSNIQRISGAE